MKLIDFFQYVIEKGITPNQFYVLWCIQEGIIPASVNIHQDLRELLVGGFITRDDDNYRLTDKAITMLNTVLRGDNTKEKTVEDIDIKSYITQYNELFPKQKLPSGKLARSNIKNLEIRFKWFLEEYKYSWDTILKATAVYVDEYEAKGYMYMRTAAYFVKKADKVQGVVSELSDYCAFIESGGDTKSDNHFHEKVV